MRSAEPTVLVALVLLAVCPGCGAATGLDAGEHPDAELTDADVDASEPDCTDPDGYLVQDYVFDGERGSTGCIPATAAITTRSASVNPTAPALLIGFGYRDEAATDITARGLPSPLCAAAVNFENTPLETGATGSMTDLQEVPESGYIARVGLRASYDPSPDELCSGGESARASGGTWRVLQGGGSGDTVEIEARDVTVEGIPGHILQLERIRWRVRLPEPTVYP